MTYEIAQLRETTRNLAVTRFTATPDQISTHMEAAFPTVFGYLGRHGIEPLGPPLACYLMAGEERWEVRVGCEVRDPIPEGEGMEPFVLAECESLSTVHVGPYDDLAKAYEALESRARELGVQLDPVLMWEEYLTGPDVPPEQTRTMIHWPLAGSR